MPYHDNEYKPGSPKKTTEKKEDLVTPPERSYTPDVEKVEVEKVEVEKIDIKELNEKIFSILGEVPPVINSKRSAFLNKTDTNSECSEISELTAPPKGSQKTHWFKVCALYTGNNPGGWHDVPPASGWPFSGNVYRAINWFQNPLNGSYPNNQEAFYQFMIQNVVDQLTGAVGVPQLNIGDQITWALGPSPTLPIGPPPYGPMIPSAGDEGPYNTGVCFLTGYAKAFKVCLEYMGFVTDPSVSDPGSIAMFHSFSTYLSSPPFTFRINQRCCDFGIPTTPCYYIGDIGPAGGLIFAVPWTGANQTNYFYEIALDDINEPEWTSTDPSIWNTKCGGQVSDPVLNFTEFMGEMKNMPGVPINWFEVDNTIVSLQIGMNIEDSPNTYIPTGTTITSIAPNTNIGGTPTPGTDTIYLSQFYDPSPNVSLSFNAWMGSGITTQLAPTLGSEFGAYVDNYPSYPSNSSFNSPIPDTWIDFGKGHINTDVIDSYSQCVPQVIGDLLCHPHIPTHDIAATQCLNHSQIGTNGDLYGDDWFLPSAFEFWHMMNQVGPGTNFGSTLNLTPAPGWWAEPASHYYWTSSQVVTSSPTGFVMDKYLSYAWNTDTLLPEKVFKCHALSVRPVRRFLCEPIPITGITYDYRLSRASNARTNGGITAMTHDSPTHIQVSDGPFDAIYLGHTRYFDPGTDWGVVNDGDHDYVSQAYTPPDIPHIQAHDKSASGNWGGGLGQTYGLYNGSPLSPSNTGIPTPLSAFGSTGTVWLMQKNNDSLATYYSSPNFIFPELSDNCLQQGIVNPTYGDHEVGISSQPTVGQILNPPYDVLGPIGGVYEEIKPLMSGVFLTHSTTGIVCLSGWGGLWSGANGAPIANPTYTASDIVFSFPSSSITATALAALNNATTITGPFGTRTIVSVQQANWSSTVFSGYGNIHVKCSGAQLGSSYPNLYDAQGSPVYVNLSWEEQTGQVTGWDHWISLFFGTAVGQPPVSGLSAGLDISNYPITLQPQIINIDWPPATPPSLSSPNLHPGVAASGLAQQVPLSSTINGHNYFLLDQNANITNFSVGAAYWSTTPWIQHIPVAYPQPWYTFSNTHQTPALNLGLTTMDIDGVSTTGYLIEMPMTASAPGLQGHWDNYIGTPGNLCVCNSHQHATPTQPGDLHALEWFYYIPNPNYIPPVFNSEHEIGHPKLRIQMNSMDTRGNELIYTGFNPYPISNRLRPTFQNNYTGFIGEIFNIKIYENDETLIGDYDYRLMWDSQSGTCGGMFCRPNLGFRFVGVNYKENNGHPTVIDLTYRRGVYGNGSRPDHCLFSQGKGNAYIAIDCPVITGGNPTPWLVAPNNRGDTMNLLNWRGTGVNNKITSLSQINPSNGQLPWGVQKMPCGYHGGSFSNRGCYEYLAEIQPPTIPQIWGAWGWTDHLPIHTPSFGYGDPIASGFGWGWNLCKGIGLICTDACSVLFLTTDGVELWQPSIGLNTSLVILPLQPGSCPTGGVACPPFFEFDPISGVQMEHATDIARWGNKFYLNFWGISGSWIYEYELNYLDCTVTLIRKISCSNITGSIGNGFGMMDANTIVSGGAEIGTWDITTNTASYTTLFPVLSAPGIAADVDGDVCYVQSNNTLLVSVYTPTTNLRELIHYDMSGNILDQTPTPWNQRLRGIWCFEGDFYAGLSTGSGSHIRDITFSPSLNIVAMGGPNAMPILGAASDPSFCTTLCAPFQPFQSPGTPNRLSKREKFSLSNFKQVKTIEVLQTKPDSVCYPDISKSDKEDFIAGLIELDDIE